MGKRHTTHPPPRPRAGLPTVKAAVGTETAARAVTVPGGATSPRTTASPGCQDKPPRRSGHIRLTRAPGPLQEETSGHNCAPLAPAPQHVCLPFYTGEVRQRVLSMALKWLPAFQTGEGNGTPLQYSCLENPMDGGAWWAAAHGVAKSRTRLSDFTFTFHFHALEEEMATHSSVLAWRIPGTVGPGGLPSMGSHRVGHD